MNIIDYGLNNRPFMRSYEDTLYSQFKLNKEPRWTNCESTLGRNFSYFIFEDNSDNYLVLFDSSDGSGLQPYDDSLNHTVLRKLMEEYNIKDYIIFKMQFSYDGFSSYYPLKSKTHPLGYFPDVPSITYEFKKQSRYRYAVQPKDIDFFWVGTIDYGAPPPLWPEDKDINQWPMGQRQEGYKTFKQIADKHSEWNIITSDRPQFSRPEYLDKTMRSKVCLELPGVGYFTTRFFENLILERCMISKELPLSLPYDLIPNVHYFAINHWDELEDKMQWIMDNPTEIDNIINNVKDLQSSLTHDYAFHNMTELINNMVLSHNL